MTTEKDIRRAALIEAAEEAQRYADAWIVPDGRAGKAWVAKAEAARSIALRLRQMAGD